MEYVLLGVEENTDAVRTFMKMDGPLQVLDSVGTGARADVEEASSRQEVVRTILG
jgi:hypothetical protein